MQLSTFQLSNCSQPWALKGSRSSRTFDNKRSSNLPKTGSHPQNVVSRLVSGAALAMSQTIPQKLNDLTQTISNLRDVEDSFFDELHTKLSKLLVQVEIQRNLNGIARTIRDGSPLPVRRINYNIKKLSEENEVCQIRWSALQKLKCPEIIFSMMAFTGLNSLHDKQFEYLVENVSNYIEIQELPRDWIARDQIKRVVANTPRRQNTQSFIQGELRFIPSIKGAKQLD